MISSSVLTRVIESLLRHNIAGMVHPKVAVVAGGETRVAGQGHMIADSVTTTKHTHTHTHITYYVMLNNQGRGGEGKGTKNKIK